MIQIVFKQHDCTRFGNNFGGRGGGVSGSSVRVLLVRRCVFLLGRHDVLVDGAN